MEKEFVPYKVAIDLVKLGFHDPCLSYYSTSNHPYLQPGILLGGNPSEPLMSADMHKIGVWKIGAPLYQQAFRWLREKYNLFGVTIPTITMDWTFKTTTLVCDMVEVPPYKHVDAYDYSSYKEAELACLKKLIEIAKQL
jgi:hypothetical protein